MTAWEAEQAKLIGSGSSQCDVFTDPDTMKTSPSPSLQLLGPSDSSFSQISIPVAPPKPPQDQIIDLKNVMYIVETSFAAFRHRIHRGDVLGLEISKMEQRIDERCAHFRARMNCVTKKTNKGGVFPLVQDGAPLKSVYMNTAFRNLNCGRLLSIIAAEEQGELSVEKCEKAVEEIQNYFDEASSNLRRIKHLSSLQTFDNPGTKRTTPISSAI